MFREYRGYIRGIYRLQSIQGVNRLYIYRYCIYYYNRRNRIKGISSIPHFAPFLGGIFGFTLHFGMFLPLLDKHLPPLQGYFIPPISVYIPLYIYSSIYTPLYTLHTHARGAGLKTVYLYYIYTSVQILSLTSYFCVFTLCFVSLTHTPLYYRGIGTIPPLYHRGGGGNCLTTLGAQVSQGIFQI